MWGLIAFGLLILFVLVGYQAATKFRSPSAPAGNTRDMNGEADGGMSVSPSRSDTVVRTTPDQKNSVPDSNPLKLDATHKLLQSAADQHQYETAIDYGRQIYNSGNAGPDDLLIIAQSYFSMGDCPNTLTWIDRANGAFHAAARESGESLRRMTRRCRSGQNTPITLTRAQCERTMPHPKRLPEPGAEAAQSKFGQAYVNLGELYFGFGDYDHAITAIQCGLKEGQVVHLDDAYVYLGRSFVAIGNIDEARNAFAKLKEVPNISPRVLFLWELYADTLR
jgi:tetratricopeptide (TPR) repeat protein